jgi:hypothetical protein
MRMPEACDRTNPDGPKFDPRWVARVCEEATAAPETTEGEAIGDAPNPHLERLLLVLGCDYRTNALDECGCMARRHCGLARGQFPAEPNAVSMSDCLRCVSGR